MAIARNLNSNKFSTPGGRWKSIWAKHRKKIVIGLVIFSVLLGIYGIFNLLHLAPGEANKQELNYQTGDQPLAQKIAIYIDAPGGLNMREEPNTTSKILKIIPDGTKLEAVEVDGEWYKVNYDGKVGWVNEKYLKRSDENDTDDTATNRLKYQNSSYNYSLTYPIDWVKMDYGPNQAAGLLSYVGFGSQLPDALEDGYLPPIAVKVTQDAKAVVDTSYKKRTSAVASNATISGSQGTKYVFTASSGVQMTAYVVAGDGHTYILEESGGYVDELAQLVATFKL